MVAGADAVVTLLHDRVDDGFLDAAGTGLRIVANVAVGYDNVDLAACERRSVIVSNTPDVLTEATADLAMALILMATRRLGEAERLIRRGDAWAWSMSFLLGSGLQGKTLGIVGLGKIGQATAHRARAFGMNVIYAGRRRAGEQVEAALDAHHVVLDEVLATADVVSLHCPLTAETRHLIDASALAKMKPAASSSTRRVGRLSTSRPSSTRYDTVRSREPASTSTNTSRSFIRSFSSSRTSSCFPISARLPSRLAPRWPPWPHGTSSPCLPETLR
jgi:lactate dehydrogenase-like 2-hydroxyacid dehydrogenase